MVKKPIKIERSTQGLYTSGIEGPNPFDEPIRMPVIKQRYAIGSDNSGHEYFIKVEELDEFHKWAEDDDPEDPGKYEEFRIDGHFTFTDPRCD